MRLTTQPRTVEDLDPAVALRHGKADPAAVLLLWCLRKAFYPLLWLGLIVAVLGGHTDEIAEAGGASAYVTSFDSAGEFFAALLSPLVIVILAVGLRFAVAGSALALAYPLTRWSKPADYAHGRKRQSRTRLWSDRWQLTKAYRALRWTWAVRQVAVSRLGRLGRQLEACGPMMRWASIGLFIAYIAVLVVTADT